MHALLKGEGLLPSLGPRPKPTPAWMKGLGMRLDSFPAVAGIGGVRNKAREEHIQQL